MPFPRQTLAPLLALALACGLAVGCAKERSRDVVEGPVPIPADEATAAERKQIDATVAEIEAIAGELARPQKFRRLPVLVVTEDMKQTNRAGACYFEGGKGKFIIVNRAVFREEERLAAFGIQTTLFRVLLHEIGHCYLARDHLEAKLSGKGRKIRFASRSPDEPDAFRDYFFNDYNVSSMESETLVMPVALKKYYVAELLGLFRASSLAELAEYSGGESVEH